MAASKLDSMALEAMRKEDSSWHPCRISLSSGDPNIGIIVDFENGEEEDVICNKEDALLRLRYRSTPLQNDECTNIKEGECVLALQKTKSKSLCIDATIEEPKRVKHSKRVHCRCTFEIKWLNSELKGETVTVPSMSILKLSDRSIAEHPLISRFLNVLNSENGDETPSVISFSQESSCEAEFIGILEKQVEEISKLVDGSKASLMDPFLEVKSGTANVVKQKSKTRHGASQRTTRSQKKHLLETERKKETEVIKEAEVKPVLTPLAARAALASFVHELPEKSLGFSGKQDFKVKDSQQSDATGTTEQSAIEATSNSVKSTLHVQNKVLLDQNPFKRMNNNTNVEDKKSSNRSRAEEKRKSHDSLDMSSSLEKEMKPSRESYGGIVDEPIARNSVKDEKNKSSTNSRRLTRSMRKELEVLSPNVVDKAPSSKSPSLEPQDIVVSSDGEDGVASTKKSSGKQIKLSPKNSAQTSDTGNKVEEHGKHDNNEIKKKRLSYSRADSTSETNSIAERNEPTTKRRTRSSRDEDLGARGFSQKDSTNPPLRSSPRLNVLPRTRSQARS